MAELAATPEARAAWLDLAGKWLAMLPQQPKTDEKPFDQMMQEKGTHQKDSEAEH